MQVIDDPVEVMSVAFLVAKDAPHPARVLDLAERFAQGQGRLIFGDPAINPRIAVVENAKLVLGLAAIGSRGDGGLATPATERPTGTT